MERKLEACFKWEKIAGTHVRTFEGGGNPDVTRVALLGLIKFTVIVSKHSSFSDRALLQELRQQGSGEKGIVEPGEKSNLHD